jgi:UDP-N-acetyl-D-glucosamine dehydrogenase
MNQRKKTINGSRVLVLGVAYKKDIDDLRESPALTVIELLQKEGAEVHYNDPYIPFVGKGRKYDLQMKSASLDEISSYDCVLIITDHSNYNYDEIVEKSQLVVDKRNQGHDQSKDRALLANSAVIQSRNQFSPSGRD